MIIATFKDASPSGRGKRKKQGSDTEDSGSDDEDEDVQLVNPAVGWAYVGSHNFTPSAWGTLSGSAFNPVLNVSPTSYEVFRHSLSDKTDARLSITSWESCFLLKTRKKLIRSRVLRGLRGNIPLGRMNPG